MTKPVTLREWLSVQSMPPHIYERVEKLLRLPDELRNADELRLILDTIPEKQMGYVPADERFLD